MPDAVESGLQQPSPWQQPPAWMAEVMERLLVMPEGHQLVGAGTGHGAGKCALPTALVPPAPAGRRQRGTTSGSGWTDA